MGIGIGLRLGQIVSVLLLAFASMPLFAGSDCVPLVITQAGARAKIRTAQDWAHIYRSLRRQKDLGWGGGYFDLEPQTTKDGGFDLETIERQREKLHQYVAGVIYDLMLSQMARAAGYLGNEPEKWQKESRLAATVYYLSFVERREPSTLSDVPEIAERQALGQRFFGTLPTLNEMLAIIDNPELSQADTENELAKLLLERIPRARRNLELGNTSSMEIYSAMLSEPFNALSVEGRGGRQYMPRAKQMVPGGMVQVWSGPFVDVRRVRQVDFETPVLLLDLTGIREVDTAPLHEIVVARAAILHPSSSENVGVALQVHPHVALSLITMFDVVEKKIGSQIND